jgi:surfeit locus 1 family protein
MIIRLFSKKWILGTILVIAGVFVLLKLGIWQRTRLIQRRDFNTAVMSQIDLPSLTLDESAIEFDLNNMEYREVVVTGEYALKQQMILRNQINGKEPGYHLLTPLKISGTNAQIIIDRGWIPIDDETPESWQKYDVAGEVEINGVFRKSQNLTVFNIEPDAMISPDEAWRQNWRTVHLEAIAGQVDNLLLAYIQETPVDESGNPPIKSEVILELTEGPHADYAAQWFAFALMLGIGYPFYVRHQDE